MKLVVIIVVSVYANLCFCEAGNTSGNRKICENSKQPININVYGKGSQKKICADSKLPININVYGKGSQKGEILKGSKGDTGSKGNNGSPCQCSLQNPNKPSAHIESANKRDLTYQANQMIKDWSITAPYSHLTGGMKYLDGKLTVPTTERYNIYLQAYYHSNGRVYVNVNSNVVTIIQPPTPGKGDEGTLYGGGVFNLKAGDITITAAHNCKIYVWSSHTYFGAYLI